jgi:hypothetical protein
MGRAVNHEMLHREVNLPDIELVSAKVHEAWIEGKRAQSVTSRKSETGEELMVPYDQLSERAKDLDRQTVRAVYAAIKAAA